MGERILMSAFAQKQTLASVLFGAILSRSVCLLQDTSLG